MQNLGWLPLNEYSSKYDISISTLRRRIKNSEIEYQFKEGKYWLKDTQSRTGFKAFTPAMTPTTDLPVSASVPAKTNDIDRLIAELKSAYVVVLQDKEEMILQLKEEVADLRTLVKILESENERLKQTSSPNSSSIGFELEDGVWLDEPLEP